MNYNIICIILIIKYIRCCYALTVTTGHCYRNVTVKYQVPITKTRLKLDSQLIEYYVEFEDRVRIDSLRMCCPGYRTIIFGLCEPICTELCPANSYCGEPEKCLCLRGYEESHNHHVRSITSKQPRQLRCRPICTGGCPHHSQCVAHNKCVCRAGYKDTSSWFNTLRCERIQCPLDQVYDVIQHKCVKVDMNLEELMQQVGKKLTKGFNILDYDEDGDVNEEDNETSSFVGSRED
ncbi:uncharacterized protein LOC119613955 [Lucilia sericata]|uniref:uncharacterized protein LOC119613955 n=1 Tax=Lucilia sericata TaxID=13632 RepID=UPI0018A83059|nr:uncharacterized protein LOC119613955 [Lucilia sericata]